MSRRFGQDERNRRELEVLHRLAVELPRSLTLVGVTDALARELVHAVDRADECTISTWVSEHDTLVNITTYEREGGFNDHYRNAVFPLCDWPESRTLMGRRRPSRVPRRRRRLVAARARASSRAGCGRPGSACRWWSRAARVGLIEIVDYVTCDRWSPRDIAFCQTIAAQAAMAVRNAQLYESLQRQVERDPLTGLLNHRALHERVASELADAQLRGGELSLIALDLDDFKGVNDRDGHLAGDDLLRQVADVLREASREDDAAGRVGGDEFVLSLPGVGADAGRGGRAAGRRDLAPHRHLRLGRRRPGTAGRARCCLADRPRRPRADRRQARGQGHLPALGLSSRLRPCGVPGCWC